MEEDEAKTTEELRAHASATPEGDPAAPFVAGMRLGPYFLLEEVGHGGMGVVYAAYDPDLDRRIALKVLAAGGSQRRFLREAQAMARLAHPSVLTVHDVGVVGAQVFIAMELVRGSTLTA